MSMVQGKYPSGTYQLVASPTKRELDCTTLEVCTSTGCKATTKNEAMFRNQDLDMFITGLAPIGVLCIFTRSLKDPGTEEPKSSRRNDCTDCGMCPSFMAKVMTESNSNFMLVVAAM